MKKKISAFLISIFFICSPLFAREIRVVSLAPNITEILFAIGMDVRQIVGVSDFCNYPQEAKSITKVGGFPTVNIEKIVSLSPDCVLSLGEASSPLNSNLKKAGLNVISVSAETISGVMDTILMIGRVVGREAEAEKLVNDMRRRLAVVEDAARKITNKKKVYVELWNDPLTTCGKNSLVDEVVRTAGGINISGNIDALYPTISQEFVIKENPDIILVGYVSNSGGGSSKEIASRFGWGNLNAVKNNGIIDGINPALFLRPGPRIVDGVEQIYRKLYENKKGP